jgi:F1F0 ATPase subunit 2
MSWKKAMTESLALAMAGLAGGALGVVFFGGLWWTVRRGASSPRPVLWFFGSLLLRTVIVLAGFYAVAGLHWQSLLLCLAGFGVARLVVTRWMRAAGDSRSAPSASARHAP